MWRALKPVHAPVPAEPIGAEEFARAMEPFALNHTSLGLAVSGGPDSMALAWSAKQWAKDRGVTLHALIVDHNLRLESASEAAETQKNLSLLGIKSEVLRWEHAPIVARLHSTARTARYKLLLEACRKNALSCLLLAHQQEDQAETILMRLAKGTGIDGLAGIAAEKKKDGIRLLRPLLTFSKERLIATCKSARIPFITDPSNHSEKFARGRLRRVMPLLAEEGLTTDRLQELGTRASEAKEALDHYAHALVRVATKQDCAGVVRFDLEHLRSAPIAVAGRAVVLCLNTLHREVYSPEYASLDRLLRALRHDAEMTPCTLQGCLISRTATQAVFMREYSAIQDAVVIKPGEKIEWDGRWQITLAATANESYAVRPLGNPPHETVDILAPHLRHRLPQGRARAALPALWRGNDLVLIPVFSAENNAKNPATAVLSKPWPPSF
ncbi:MAG: tRNA lysidine(34) synthetase TilS [Alphaproteobacteria bacterium]